jgi:hypothetical protein
MDGRGQDETEHRENLEGIVVTLVFPAPRLH